MRRYEISDYDWQRLSSLLPGKSTDVGRTAKDNRQFINAVLWIARSGAPWRDLPERAQGQPGRPVPGIAGAADSPPDGRSAGFSSGEALFIAGK